jgi:hypothetical protein
MPRLVADIHSGALAPRSALGYARIPGQIEWELLPVATTQLTPIAAFGMHAVTYKTERGRQDRLFLPPLFPLFEKGVVRIDSDDSGFDFCMPLISGNRVIGHRHNLGTFHNFGASAPEPNPQKTGAAHSLATSSEAAAAFNLNGQSPG